ncbi:MAG TPA: glycoside hydrolase family 2 TIM barrel-domain containing protein [Candidatus Limnocylindrales bacterium]|nr:glycoside hydrolase family 2 TIM barrel-domain containing protein [Candidatus Limnocylindrales bacterium]
MTPATPRSRRRIPRPPLGRVVAAAARPGSRWRSRALRSPLVRRLALVGVTVALGGCVPTGDAGELPPTLAIESVHGGEVAVQNGIPVPSFTWPSRPRRSLDGPWRVERREFDSDLSLTPRDVALPRIEEQAAGRQGDAFDDSSWARVDVPGTLNPAPDRREVGGWYRKSFFLPASWSGQTLTLKFGAANYLADVWLNGVWLGYHEGGTTPFAFDATAAARPGESNVLAVRVDNPPWGSRNDIVPWGLADWWNFGGLTRPVWIEASAPVHAVRADVVPHLDGADLSVVVRNAGSEAAEPTLTFEVLPATVTDANVLERDPRRLITTGARPLVRTSLGPERLEAGEIARLDTSFILANAATWSPRSPSLYVLRVTVSIDGRVVDRMHETFGLRQVAVDTAASAVLLNGRPVFLAGVALHDQHVSVGPDGRVAATLPTRAQLREQLDRAESVGAHLIRTGHSPANPVLLDLADRLGFAVWEEIPLYHYTPQTYDVAMGRGIPQQMLREMALRDMNRPSVLFHGLSNESTGEEARSHALAELHEIDRAIDGTRLTGQAAYGFAPADQSNGPLDVAGLTSYHGVFYGSDAATDTTAALDAVHIANPGKPVMVLEFGRWADGRDGEAAQRRVFDETAPAILDRRATLPGGFVSAGTWWTLEDYATLRPNLELEQFGMFAADGNARPVADGARALFGSLPIGLEGTPLTPVVPGGQVTALPPTQAGWVLLGYLAYAVVVSLALLGGAFALLLRRGGRGRRRPVTPVRVA